MIIMPRWPAGSGMIHAAEPSRIWGTAASPHSTGDMSNGSGKTNSRFTRWPVWNELMELPSGAGFHDGLVRGDLWGNRPFAGHRRSLCHWRKAQQMAPDIS